MASYLLYSLHVGMQHTDVEYSDAQCEWSTRRHHTRAPDIWSWEEYSDIQADELAAAQEEMLLLAYDKFIAYHDRLTESEAINYWWAISTDEKLKWAA